MLIIICGLPGVGKSFVAKKLANKFGAKHISFDHLINIKEKDKIFSRKLRYKIHKRLLNLAQRELEKKKVVILESGFSQKEQRKKAEDLVKNTNNKKYLIEIICPENVVKERLKKRLEGDSNSTAGCEVYNAAKKNFEGIKEKDFVINASKNVDKQIGKLILELEAKN